MARLRFVICVHLQSHSSLNDPFVNFSLLLQQAALTSSRTAANSIYCPPILQTSLDPQSGIHEEYLENIQELHLNNDCMYH